MPLQEKWDALAPSAQAGLAAIALKAAAVVTIISLVFAAVTLQEAHVAWRSAMQRAAMRGSAAGSSANAVPTTSEFAPFREADVVSDLPANTADDVDNAEIRFATRLAHEQGVDVQQVQIDLVKTPAGHLGQHRLALQLRGAYRDIKLVWIGLLDKFPGLTLERLALHRRSMGGSATVPSSVGGPLSPADRAELDATIEMIQYLQPVKASP